MAKKTVEQKTKAMNRLLDLLQEEGIVQPKLSNYPIILSSVISRIVRCVYEIEKTEDYYEIPFNMIDKLGNVKLDKYEEYEFTDHGTYLNPFKKPYLIKYRGTVDNSGITMEVYNYRHKNKGFVAKTTFTYLIRNLVNYVSGNWDNNLIFKLEYHYVKYNKQTGKCEGDELPFNEVQVRLNENMLSIDVAEQKYKLRASRDFMCSVESDTKEAHFPITDRNVLALLQVLKVELNEDESDNQNQ